MIDVEALKLKYVGYSNIIKHIEIMDAVPDQRTRTLALEKLEQTTINGDRTFTFGTDDGVEHTLSLAELDAFLGGVHKIQRQMDRAAQGLPPDEGEDQ